MEDEKLIKVVKKLKCFAIGLGILLGINILLQIVYLVGKITG